jgi:hypothetical protein
MVVTFGPDWDTAFNASPYSLRFSLSDDADPGYVAMFTLAYDRARALFEDVFADSSKVFAVIAAAPAVFEDPIGRAKYADLSEDGFKALTLMGLAEREVLHEWLAWPFWGEPECDDVLWRHRVLDVTGDRAARDLMLWSNLAQDLGVRPVAPAHCRFVDPQRGILLNAYDDRGMDVVALDLATLADFRVRRDAWVLDYDRDRIAQVFGALAG